MKKNITYIALFTEKILSIFKRNKKNFDMTIKMYQILLKQMLKENETLVSHIKKIDENFCDNRLNVDFNLMDYAEVINFVIEAIYRKQDKYTSEEEKQNLQEISDLMLEIILKFENFDYKYEKVKSNLEV